MLPTELETDLANGHSPLGFCDMKVKGKIYRLEMGPALLYRTVMGVKRNEPGTKDAGTGNAYAAV